MRETVKLRDTKRSRTQVMNQEQRKTVTEQIWRELSDRLRQFVRSRIESTADVDDVLQTIFLRIHTHFADLRKAERLNSWVFQIARNAITDYFRKRRDTHGDVETLVGDSDNGHSGNLNSELTQCVEALIMRLPEEQRRALSLYELEGKSQKEIADRESISLSGAKSRIQRGRKSLERILKACCEFQFDRRGNVVEYKANDADCCEEKCD